MLPGLREGRVMPQGGWEALGSFRNLKSFRNNKTQHASYNTVIHLSPRESQNIEVKGT